MPRTLLLLPPMRLPPSGLMASPQFGPSRIYSWVKLHVALGGLTRYNAEDGSCNREIRVVLSHQIAIGLKLVLANLGV